MYPNNEFFSNIVDLLNSLNNNNDISKKALKDLNEYFKSIGYEDLGLKTKADISKLINKIESGELETSRIIGVKIKEGAKTLVIDNNKDYVLVSNQIDNLSKTLTYNSRL